MPEHQSDSGQRFARAGETCKCGRPAVVVYITERFGEVPYCGIPDGGADVAATADHDEREDQRAWEAGRWDA